MDTVVYEKHGSTETVMSEIKNVIDIGYTKNSNSYH